MRVCDQRKGGGRRLVRPKSGGGAGRAPPVSVPRAAGARRAATAAALPPLEPPGMRVGSYGLRAGPNAPLLLVGPKASSCKLVLPSTIAPASTTGGTVRAIRFGAWRRGED